MITNASLEQAFDQCNLTIDKSAIAQCTCSGRLRFFLDDSRLTLVLRIVTEFANEMGYSASEMAEKWDVYSMNNAISEPANAQGLLSLKPSLVSNKRQKPTTSTTSHQNKENYTNRTPVAIRKKSKSAHLTKDDDLPSPGLMHKRVKFQSPSTPASLHRPKGAPSLFSPTTLASPMAGMTYDQRTTAGQVVQEFNPELKLQLKSMMTQMETQTTTTIGSSQFSNNTSADFSYMHTPLTERAKVLERQLVDAQAAVEAKYDLSHECGVIGDPSPSSVIVVGRICCDAAEGKLNTTVVMLEGSRASCGGQRVPLDLSHVSTYTVFPGKIVALEGVYNTMGAPFLVKRFLDPVTAPMPRSSLSMLESGHRPVRVLTACGPFTCNDNANYMPLNDLIEIAKVDRPNVVILVGPFIDATHPSFKDGAVEYEDMTVNFMDIFLFKGR